jgi:biopolymer transport protein ExbD
MNREVRRRPELSVAPLIDCVFLLLIFFTVTTTFKKELGINVEKPKAKSLLPLPYKNLIVSLTKEGRIFLDNLEVNKDTLKLKVSQRLEEEPKLAVIIEVDERTPTGKLIEVMDICKEAGAQDLSIAASLKRDAF